MENSTEVNPGGQKSSVLEGPGRHLDKERGMARHQDDLQNAFYKITCSNLILKCLVSRDIRQKGEQLVMEEAHAATCYDGNLTLSGPWATRASMPQ